MQSDVYDNMADHSLVSTESSSKSCCRYLDFLDIADGSIPGVKANPLLSLPSCSPLFITVWRLVKHKTNDCLNSGILNE